ncbi:MAG: helix-turn-helix domain-containing protein [Phycisphaerae bacterium]|nr:helix-turn-helix domain-containing protein [Phycisphaerae bacterium]
MSEKPAPSNGDGLFVKVPIEILARKDLTPAAKLVLAVVADRIGENGRAWPGIRRLGEDCGLGRNAALRSIQELEAVELLIVEHVEGNPARRTNTYRLSTTYPIQERTRSRDVPETDVGRTRNGTGYVPETGTEPDQENQIKRTRSRRARGATVPSPEVEAIYAAYPRKVGRPKALEGIAKAIERIRAKGNPDPAAWLLGRTKLFASSPAGDAGRFTPHPTTWFNQERYDDDEQEWHRNGERSGTSGGPARIDATPGKYARVAQKIGSGGSR